MTHSQIPEASVLSVKVGGIREVEARGRTVRTGIWKKPVDGPVQLRGVNLEGDDQADRSVHGGPDKAVYAYALEDYAYWAAPWLASGGRWAARCSKWPSHGCRASSSASAWVTPHS